MLLQKLRSARQVYAEGGLRRVGRRSRANVRGFASSLYPSTHIYEREWDVLLVLDACRLDLMTEVAPEYDYIESVGSLNSVASKTTEWLEKTFVDEYATEMRNTVYVSGNPNTGIDWIGPGAFQRLDNVWDNVWDDDLGTMPPGAITDRGISLHRELAPDRTILHYMQPHVPFVSNPELDSGIPADRLDPPYHGASDNKIVWDRLRDGQVDSETVWEAYRDNLKYVLDDIETLLSNLDADRVVLTSDHGNAMGEFGVYGHPRHTPIPAIRLVPWVETTATDERTHEPALEPDADSQVTDVESQLRDLGYMD